MNAHPTDGDLDTAITHLMATPWLGGALTILRDRLRAVEPKAHTCRTCSNAIPWDGYCDSRCMDADPVNRSGVTPAAVPSANPVDGESVVNGSAPAPATGCEHGCVTAGSCPHAAGRAFLGDHIAGPIPNAVHCPKCNGTVWYETLPEKCAGCGYVAGADDSGELARLTTDLKQAHDDLRAQRDWLVTEIRGRGPNVAERGLVTMFRAQHERVCMALGEEPGDI